MLMMGSLFPLLAPRCRFQCQHAVAGRGVQVTWPGSAQMESTACCCRQHTEAQRAGAVQHIARGKTGCWRGCLQLLHHQVDCCCCCLSLLLWEVSARHPQHPCQVVGCLTFGCCGCCCCHHRCGCCQLLQKVDTLLGCC